ncbi:MAG: hypothetical protein J5959_03780 [Butyrivibrio sp.]|nr:hypothetical protein [Butyrivibrio sp.]
MKMTKDAKMAWLMSGLFGVLASVFLVFGYQLESGDAINLSDNNVISILLMFILIFTIDTRYVWRNYDSALNGGKLFGIIRLPKGTGEAEVQTKEFLINHLAMILLSVPVLLAEFPGFFVYDAQDELNEVLTRSFTTHHPLLHVLLLGGIIALFHKISGSWNAGILAYIFLQMLVITAIFAYVVTYMQKRGIGKRSRVLWVLYYGAFPTIVMYTLCSCKDGLFSALLLLMTTFLIQLVNDPEGFLANKRKLIAFVLTALFMPMFRHNGFYAYLVFVPFALIYFRKRLKPVLVGMLIAPLGLYLALSGILSMACRTEGTHHQEMLTVPIMQLVRVYAYDGDTLSPQEKELIEAYIPKNNLDKYTPRVSDMVKVDFNNKLYEQNSSDFWMIWKAQLVKHPMAYVNAWLLTSYGYWYPPAIINVYKGNTVYSFTYEDSSYFGYEVEPPGERKSLIPAIDDLYRYLSIGSFQQDAPVLHLFFGPGLYVFIFMFVFAYRIYKKRFGSILPFMPMILTFCTVLLGPTYLVRYVLYLWLCIPRLVITGKSTTKAYAAV